MALAAPEVWDRPDVVGGFSRAAPNQQLLDYARRHRRPWSSTRVLDIGCGAGRNAVPLANTGFHVTGIDRSRPMLAAAASRDAGRRMKIVEGRMDELPIGSGTIDLIVAHGVWNLARSDAEFRAAVAEAARVAAPGAALFVFTFSRSTIPAGAAPVQNQRFVFTQFSGAPQVFLTRNQLIDEMVSAGFTVDHDLSLRELNVPPAGVAQISGPPAIFEAAFRFQGV